MYTIQLARTSALEHNREHLHDRRQDCDHVHDHVPLHEERLHRVLARDIVQDGVVRRGSEGGGSAR